MSGTKEEEEDKEGVLIDDIIIIMEESDIIEGKSATAAYKEYSPVPPPCLPVGITSLCTHVCDNPGVSAVILAAMAVLVVLEILAVCYCGNLGRRAFKKCLEKIRKKKEDADDGMENGGFYERGVCTCMAAPKLGPNNPLNFAVDMDTHYTPE